MTSRKQLIDERNAKRRGRIVNKTADLFDVETIIRELELAIQNPLKAQRLTNLLGYASKSSLESAIIQLRKMKNEYKNL